VFQSGYRRLLIGVVLVTWLLLPACTAFGPKRLPRDRFNYNQAISRSWNEQMLLNVVRLRYVEMPVFLDVGSVLTQYTYEGSVGASGSVGDSGFGFDQSIAGGEASLGYSERPTITYIPVTGRAFARRLYSPIPAEVVFSLAQAGWAMDLIMPICLQRINEVENMSFTAVPSPEDQENLRKFHRVLELFEELGERDVFEMYRDQQETESVRYLVFDENQNPETQAIIDELKRMLGLDLQENVFRVTDRVTRRRPNEITLQMRSMLAMMLFLSRGIDVPAVHLEERWAVNMPLLADDEARTSMFPWRVRSAVDRPDNAFGAVRYRGHWFYIEMSDGATKRAFALLTFFFRLLAPDLPAAAPILSLPTGP
jgi:hypothetical protein